MRLAKYILLGLLLILFLGLSAVQLFDIITLVIEKGRMNRSAIITLLPYRQMVIGVLIYLFIHRFFNKNINWLQVFSHELTHAVVALFFFRKIHSLEAGTESGVVWTSGQSNRGMIAITLAPYCFPLFTFILLALRSIIAPSHCNLFDVFIGMSIAFHVLTFVKDTHDCQSDILAYPTWFSYLYIWTFRTFNLSVVIVSVWTSKNLFTGIYYLLEKDWGLLKELILYVLK